MRPASSADQPVPCIGASSGRGSGPARSPSPRWRPYRSSTVEPWADHRAARCGCYQTRRKGRAGRRLPGSAATSAITAARARWRHCAQSSPRTTIERFQSVRTRTNHLAAIFLMGRFRRKEAGAVLGRDARRGRAGGEDACGAVLEASDSTEFSGAGLGCSLASAGGGISSRTNYFAGKGVAQMRPFLIQARLWQGVIRLNDLSRVQASFF